MPVFVFPSVGICMNLPSGAAVKTGLDLATVDFFALLRELQLKAFNGYLVVGVPGREGLEEGTLLFDTGKVVASIYEYLAFQRNYYGAEALERTLNAALAKQGVIDVFQLTPEQVQLVLAFNEQAIVIPSEKELKNWQGKQHSYSYEEEVVRASRGQPKEDLLKQYKMSPVKPAEVAPPAPTGGPAEELMSDLMKRAKKGAERK